METYELPEFDEPPEAKALRLNNSNYQLKQLLKEGRKYICYWRGKRFGKLKVYCKEDPRKWRYFGIFHKNWIKKFMGVKTQKEIDNLSKDWMWKDWKKKNSKPKNGKRKPRLPKNQKDAKKAKIEEIEETQSVIKIEIDISPEELDTANRLNEFCTDNIDNISGSSDRSTSNHPSQDKSEIYEEKEKESEEQENDSSKGSRKETTEEWETESEESEEETSEEEWEVDLDGEVEKTTSEVDKISGENKEQSSDKSDDSFSEEEEEEEEEGSSIDDFKIETCNEQTKLHKIDICNESQSEKFMCKQEDTFEASVSFEHTEKENEAFGSDSGISIETQNSN
jgi:hypothetical protein